MSLIYEPRGRAREYAPLACNIYRGCSHGCLYCWAPACLRVKPEDFRAGIRPREGILGQIAREAPRYAGDERDVLISFTSDPYQPLELELGVVRRVLEIFQRNDVKFTILTKGGTRAARDFDIMREARCSFATTLLFTDDADRQRWEPGAASVEDRKEAIARAHDLGVHTWVSIEPVIDPDQALALVERLHRIVDFWKVGKLNYHPLAKSIDWAGFLDRMLATLSKVKAKYYIKKDLAAFQKK